MRERLTSKFGVPEGRPALGLACVLVLLASGCKLFDTTCGEDERNCLGSFPLGVGGECERNGDCAEGLACVEGACALTGETPDGDSCRLTGECGDGRYCAAVPGCTPASLDDTCRVCTPAGDAVAGAACTLTGDCESGLVCEPPNLADLQLTTLNAVAEASGTCAEAGTLEQGEACASTPDCLAGLVCLPDMEDELRCQSLPVELPALPALWDGAECPDLEDSDTQRALFDVPRGDEDPSSFYALPFPNDIRRKGSRIDLSSHPRADDEFGLPFVGRYLDLSSEDLEGFSTNPTIFFRFSHPFDFQSVTGDGVQIVDITPTSPEYDASASIEWKVTEGDISNYICPHWLGLRRPVGNPLRPGTTYAAIVRTSIQPSDGGNFARGEDLSAMLASAAPSDPDLATAHSAYAPLRAWIADTGMDAGAILNATVFTTQDPEAMIRKLRAAIDDGATPSVSDVTVCASASTTSPCEDAEGRGACRAASDDFTEIHGRIRLPMFQQGTLPYLEPEDGGAIELDGNGDPIVADELDVCFALAVPNATPPADGFPVLLYGHGTGGSFVGEMGADGVAQAMATAAVPIATLAIDLPMHGERRGASTEEPDNLFFNFLNPRAGRDNALQGAVDYMSLVKWVRAGAPGSTTTLDPAHVALFGHSQGATHGAIMISYEPGIVAAVLSGLGGHLATSLMTKTSPVDITAALPFALLDPDSSFELAGGSYNPALAIVQGFFDRVDPINFGRLVWRDPSAAAPTGQHFFMTYGLSDTYSPNATQDAYAKAAAFTHVEPVLQSIGLATAPAPMSGNATVGGEIRTVGMRQYTPTGGDDGHFVATSSGTQGAIDALGFLEQALAGDTPAIGQ